VHRHSFQRWTVIVLLLSRLVFGEFAHALPHAGSLTADAAVAAQAAHAAQSTDGESPCAEHKDTVDRTGTAGDHDCCKAGACDCPCMHLPQASLPVFTLSFERNSAVRPVTADDGLVRHRLSTLFRPPA
jgi:hypothetical protein